MPKQYIIQYPEGTVKMEDGKDVPTQEIAASLLQALLQGGSVSVPTTWNVQVIDLPNTAPSLRPAPKELTEEEFQALLKATTPIDTSRKPLAEEEYLKNVQG